MKKDHLYDNLIGELRKKIPNGALLTTRLMECLKIEREAVYRRLRGDVPFTFAEIATLTKEFSISLDKLIDSRYENTRPFQMRLIEYSAPQKDDRQLLRGLIDKMKSSGPAPDSEIYIASNIIPQNLYIFFLYLTRYFLFKWNYMFSEGVSPVVFSNIKADPKTTELQVEFAETCALFDKCCFIWDHDIFRYIVNDIKYFESVMLITREEVQTLKKELLLLMGKIEELTVKGTFGGKNKLQIYISSINIDTNYCYIDSGDYRSSIIQTFTMNTIASSDEISFENFRRWIKSYKRLSTMISESGEMQRIQFIEKQKEIIGRL